MSYQFIHIEAYSLNVSKKSKIIGSKKSEKSSSNNYNNETKGRSVREIVAEATREKGFSDHVEKPELSDQNKILYGCSVQEVEILAQNYFDNTKQKQELKSGKTVEKGLRKDANVLLAGVVSVNSANSEIWEEYKKEAIEFLKLKYGHKLKCVIEHKDENHPHFHFYAIEDVGEKFELHDGKKAISDNKDLKLIDRNNEYKKAMEEFQENFFLNVSSKFGLTKDGPKRSRLSNSDYRKLSNEVNLIAIAKKNNQKEILNSRAKLEFEKEREIEKVSIDTKKRVIADFESKSGFWGFGKKNVLTNAKIEVLNDKIKVFSSNNKKLRSKLIRIEEKEKERVKSEIENSKLIYKKLSYADNLVKDYNLQKSYNFELNNKNHLLEIENNELKKSNSDLEKEKDKLQRENFNLKSTIDKVKTIFKIDNLAEFIKKNYIKPSI